MKNGDGSTAPHGNDRSSFIPHPSSLAVHLLIWKLDGRVLALPLAAVERVVRAVAVTPLPDAPDTLLGVIDVQGQVLPVFDLRKHFDAGAEPRAVQLNDRFIIARAGEKTIVLRADDVIGLEHRAQNEIEATTEVFSSAAFVTGVLQREGELVLVCDPKRLLAGNTESLGVLPDD